MRFLIIITTSVLLFLSSCGNIEEEYVINKDGSGQFTMQSDIMPAMINMTSAFSKASDKSEKQAKKELEESIWKDFNGTVDSTIDFKEGIPDSIKNDPETKKIMENMRMFMKGSEKEKALYMGATFTFSDGKELNGFFDFLNNQNKGKESKTGLLSSYTSANAKTKVSFDGSSFKRTTVVISEANMSEKEEGVIEEIYEESLYRTTIIMPGKIKSAIGNGLVKIKGNKAIFEYDFMKTMKGTENTDVIITLK